MTLTIEQQTFELINNGGVVLLATTPTPSLDSFSSIKAIEAILTKLGKQVHTHIPFSIPENALFINEGVASQSPSHPTEDFILHIQTAEKPIKEIRYEEHDGTLSIIITPKRDPITKDDLIFSKSTPRYDLIITLNTPDLESLGEIFEQNPHLFFETPIINIDSDPGNELFGEINILDITASSTSEVTSQLIERIDPTLLTNGVATMLLAGIIARTNNFRTSGVKPQTMSLVASLISRGADHETIIRNFYKTKPLALLKLLGRILSRINIHEDRALVWSFVPQRDFRETNTTPEYVTRIMGEIKEQFPHIETILLFWETLIKDSENTSPIRGVAQTTKAHELESLKRMFGGEIKQGFLVMNSVAENPDDLTHILHKHFPPKSIHSSRAVTDVV